MIGGPQRPGREQLRRPRSSWSPSRRVAVVGGGPGGLFAARLVRLARPDWHVTVYEHNGAEQTYGFGVGLTPATLANLHRADPQTAEDVLRVGHRAAGMLMQVADAGGTTSSTTLDDPGGAVAIGRRELLRILRTRATDAGVDVRVGTHVELSEIEADLVVAADGHASPIRNQLGQQLEVRVDLGRSLYLWCGTDTALPRITFAPAHTRHGTFVVHAYPYAPDRSTFLVETDERTWRAAGLDAGDTAMAAGASDTQSLTYLERVFAGLLDGHRLLGNGTRWQRFATVTTQRWSSGRVVLLGDAAHTAHYSIGSGTKLALEDAIALAGSLGDQEDLPAALAGYEHARRPQVKSFQALARHSSDWWESFPRRLDLSADRVTVSYMTRAGNIQLAQLAGRHPDVAFRAATDFADQAPPPVCAAPDLLAEWVLQQPLRTGPLSTGSRVVQRNAAGGWRPAAGGTPLRVAALPAAADDPWGPSGDQVVQQARRLQEDGAQVLWISGPRAGGTPVPALALAERVRLDTGGPVGIDLAADRRDDAAASLLAGRIDLVCLRTEPADAATFPGTPAAVDDRGTSDERAMA